MDFFDLLPHMSLNSPASALQFLHERNISHLDLKPQNILLSSLEKPHLKLAGVSGGAGMKVGGWVHRGLPWPGLTQQPGFSCALHCIITL